MSKATKSTTVRVQLPSSQLSDKEKIDALSAVAGLAPTATLYTQNAQVKSAVDAAVQLSTKLKGAADQENNLNAQIVHTRETKVELRSQLGLAVELIRSTIESLQPSVEECAALGLGARIGKAAPAPLSPPTSIQVHLGRKHGQFRVSAVAPGRPKFGAQASADPVGAATWQDLPGTGRARTVTGHASGALVWVRFRVLRGQTPSDWSAPVSVTVP